MYKRQVFTPKGIVKELPRGSTPVDFAYAIHTEVGDHCVGAKVNGKIVPLRYKMQNGDMVEVLTSPQAHPSKDWLTFVKTSRAQQRVLRAQPTIRQVEHAQWLVTIQIRCNNALALLGSHAFHPRSLSLQQLPDVARVV